MKVAAFLLMTYPAASLAYLFAVRAGAIAPRFEVAGLLALAPLAASPIALRAWQSERPRAWLLVTAAVLELLWALLTLAITGFAIAWRSG